MDEFWQRYDRTYYLVMIMRDLLRPLARRIPQLRTLYWKFRPVPEEHGTNRETGFPSRMNFGCGYDKREGYLNVDIDPECRPDLLIREGDYSGIPHDYFEEIYTNDVLEHILRAQTLSALLDWASWLKMGGTLWFQTSSMLGVAEWLQRSKTFSEHHRWTIGMFGSQAHEGDFHHTGFTELTLKVHLLAAELELQKMELRDGWLLRVTATKERAWDGYIASLSRETDEVFIRETFQRAVGQEPSADQLHVYMMRLQARSTTRWRIAKEVFQSDHRLFATAARYSL